MLLLSFSATLVVHQAAYGLATTFGYLDTVSHGHLAVLWQLGMAAGVVGMAAAVMTSLRSRDRQVDRPALMAATIAATFTALEMVERAVEGAVPTVLFTEAVFWCGLAVVAPVTVAFVVFLRSVSTIAVRLLKHDREPVWGKPALLWRQPFKSISWRVNPLTNLGSMRGPPVFVLT